MESIRPNCKESVLGEKSENIKFSFSTGFTLIPKYITYLFCSIKNITPFKSFENYIFTLQCIIKSINF